MLFCGLVIIKQRWIYISQTPTWTNPRDSPTKPKCSLEPLPTTILLRPPPSPRTTPNPNRQNTPTTPNSPPAQNPAANRATNASSVATPAVVPWTRAAARRNASAWSPAACSVRRSCSLLRCALSAAGELQGVIDWRVYLFWLPFIIIAWMHFY